MKEKIKSLSLTKAKISEAEYEGRNERRVTFVASTANEDRDYEVVQIDSFRLPLKGGGHIVVNELPITGADNVDIPLLTNHDLWDVSKAIGSVRRAFFQDGQLIFEAGISSREYAQDIFKLIEEGHLDNAFSIQYRDYQHDTAKNIDTGGEIIEVSVVTRGSNKDAQVLEIKALKGEDMEDDKSTVTADAPDEQQPAKAPESDTDTAENADGTSSEGQKQNQEEKPIEEETSEENNNPSDNEKEKEMNDLPDHNSVAAKQVKVPSQAETSAKSTNDYLKSKSAVLDFAKLAKKCNGDAATTQEAWKEHLATKGVTVTGQDGFYPTAVEQVIFKAWHDAIGALATFRRTRAKAFKFYAMTTESRAQGHKKGEKKVDQDVVAIPRNGGLKVIYKKLPLDWIDIVNDDSGELYVFRTRELYDRVLSEIVRGSILGDGREEPTTGQPDYRDFDGVNGLYPMADDILNSGTAGSFASAVATLIPNVSTDDNYAKIVKTLGEVNTESGRKPVLVIAKGMLQDFLLAKNDAGARLYPIGTDFKELFGVEDIIEFPAEDMEAAGLDVIAYVDQGYTLGGPDTTVRNWFDGNINQDVMLVEQPVFGSLEGRKVAAGYASK